MACDCSRRISAVAASECVSIRDSITKKLSDLSVNVLANAGYNFPNSRQITIRQSYGHHWVTLRIFKFLALNFHSNTFCALVASCSVMAMYLAWKFFGSQPVVFFGVIFGRKVGFLWRVLFVPLFFAIHFLARPLLACLGIKVPIVFVDRVCINQDNASEVSLDIKTFGAFPNCSRETMVVYTDAYFTRLWTVYEVTSFLALQPTYKLNVVPALVVVAFYSNLILCWFGNLLSAYVHAYGLPGMIVDVVKAVCCGIYAYILRRWVREKQQIKESLDNFDLRCCLWADARDRPILSERVATLMKSAQFCRVNSSVDEALDTFNMFVRSELPKAFNVSPGRISFDYKSLVLMSSVMMGLNALHCSFNSSLHNQLRAELSDSAYGLVWTFLYFPILLGSIEILVSYQLHLIGVKEVAWVLLTVSCLSGIAVGLDYGLIQLTHHAYVSDFNFYLIAGIFIIQFIIAAVGCCYCRPRRHRLLNHISMKTDEDEEVNMTEVVSRKVGKTSTICAI